MLVASPPPGVGLLTRMPAAEIVPELVRVGLAREAVGTHGGEAECFVEPIVPATQKNEVQ